ncbi:S-adenosylmethionine:tRNA ribosyltransferase-isomerase [Paenibacillus piri]|uniref:S-adenosylmethionine:tRNA ribosyltransferase-isomerase n=1 Tax=Paenibacillus piri TaxID=2547395 RepID=A0A4V2ZSZ6_9BACL|nr:S-adenosylmethionine:tRNA ribosyltransferase-isomerase [Paenibacillus piri]TDF95094.1 S-adenosylmethionine:tRNA ribosyltransferase-isomerase [Paenibacillus piri]
MDTKTVVFELPDELNAASPPERRGIRRDHVKLLVLDRQTGHRSHAHFHQLGEYVQPGDLLVLNASRTIPCVLYGVWRRSGAVMAARVEIRLARRLNGAAWEALAVDATVEAGDTFEFSPALSAVAEGTSVKPLIRIVFSLEGAALMDQIYAWAEPVRYEYIRQPWELDYYQTVYASVPGSVEMPSAGRAFSWELLFKLQRSGVRIAYVQLHTGLSYIPESGGHPDPTYNFEQFEVPAETIEAIKQTMQRGGKVIAVGTTVVRALESSVDASREPVAMSGWTNLMINRTTPLQVVNGLISGFHEPEASHLELLSAFVDPDMLYDAYREAIELGYLWHEFGDMNLII